MKLFSLPYFQVFITLILTVYGQIIIKHRINMLGNYPLDLKEKIKFFINLFLDPYIISGLLAAVLASIFWMAAMTKLPITRAYPIMSIAPALVLVFGIFFFNESLTYGKFFGLILIIIGAFVTVKF